MSLFLPEPQEHIVQGSGSCNLSMLHFAPQGRAKLENTHVVILGHAMMVDRATLANPGRPSMASSLVEDGFDVIVPDLRGRGNSTPPQNMSEERDFDWSYDELVQDIGEFVRVARSIQPDAKVSLVGHSLFGHLCLAWQGLNPDVHIDSTALLAVNTWQKSHCASKYRYAVKSAQLSIASIAINLYGCFPAAQWGYGTVDEAPTYFRDLMEFWHKDRWTSRDGRIDYQKNLSQIKTPVLHVVSEADTLMAHPVDALLWSKNLANREVWQLKKASKAPDHMRLCTSPKAQGIWKDIGKWIRRAAMSKL